MPTIFPYPGLRPFRCDETDIFFGREEQTDELLRKLSQTRFLGIVGPSGCGKSSLVLAGMIPALESGYMVSAGAFWKIARMRPGNNPVRQLAEALMNNAALGNDQKGEYAFQFVEATLRQGPKGLVEILEETPLLPSTNLLILVDQFEELFRLRNEINCNDQAAFVALLLETVAQPNLPVYVVMTMRSDYFGDCALFPGLPEALNQCQYLTPRMSREQRQEAITGPARVFGGDVEPALVNRLLNETGNDPIQLPILQHILMQMWACTTPKKFISSNDPFYAGIPEHVLGHILTISIYEQVGGIAGALSKHADQAFNSLVKEQKPVAEMLFRTLCEREIKRRDGRSPTSIKDIAARIGVISSDIINIIDVFRSPVYGFLLPAYPETLNDDTLIDITHESLISLWKTLEKWLDKEVDSAKKYSFLIQAARNWKDGDAAEWGSPGLEYYLAWIDREKPTAAWTEQYGGNFQLAKEFLGASENKQKLEKAKIIQQQKNERQRLIFSTLIIITCVICSFLYLYLVKVSTPMDRSPEYIVIPQNTLVPQKERKIHVPAEENVEIPPVRSIRPIPESEPLKKSQHSVKNTSKNLIGK